MYGTYRSQQKDDGTALLTHTCSCSFQMTCVLSLFLSRMEIHTCKFSNFCLYNYNVKYISAWAKRMFVFYSYGCNSRVWISVDLWVWSVFALCWAYCAYSNSLLLTLFSVLLWNAYFILNSLIFPNASSNVNNVTSASQSVSLLGKVGLFISFG